MVLGLQIFLTLSRVGSEAFVGPARGALAHPRAGPGARARSWSPAGRLGPHRRDRHHADHRADRRAHGDGAQPDALPGRARDRGGRHHLPAHDRALRRGRASSAATSWRCSCWGCRPGTYFGEMQTFVDMTRHHGRVLEVARRSGSSSRGSAPTRASTRARRRGRGARHDRGGRALLGADPRVRLLPGLGAAVIRGREASYKRFGGQPVLRGVDLEVATGEIMVIIGRSGGGKSVLLKHLLGPAPPRRGPHPRRRRSTSPRLRGARARPRSGERYGVVFQGGALFDSHVGLRQRRLPPPGEDPAARRRDSPSASRRSSRRWGSPSMGHKYPAEISGGMRKRVGHRPRAGDRARDRLLRRADHRARPDPGQHHPPPDSRAAPEVRVHRGDGEPRDPGDLRRSPTGSRCSTTGVIVEAGPPEAIQGSANPVVRQFIRGRGRQCTGGNSRWKRIMRSDLAVGCSS